MIKILHGPGTGPGNQKTVIPKGSRLRVGRSHSKSDIRILDGLASREHFVITDRPDDKVTLTDLSSNGTWVNGARVDLEQPVTVEPGSTIVAGLTGVFKIIVLQDKDGKDELTQPIKEEKEN